MQLPSTCNWHFGAPKMCVFIYTLYRVQSFENGDSSYSCERAKTEVFKYDDIMPRFKACSSAHMIQKCYVWMQIFLNVRRKKPPFSNILSYVWTVKYDSKMLCVDAGFFKIWRKKSPSSKMPGYVWTRPLTDTHKVK